MAFVCDMVDVPVNLNQMLKISACAIRVLHSTSTPKTVQNMLLELLSCNSLVSFRDPLSLWGS